MNTKKQHYPLWRRLIKILLWTAMAVMLLFAGILISLVTLLGPERLTPLVNDVANRALDIETHIGRIELSAISTYPFLQVDIDDVSAVNKGFAASHDTVDLPEYSDTIMVVKHVRAELNLPSLLLWRVNLRNVDIEGLGLNAVIADSLSANYDVFPESDTDEESDLSSLPKIEISRFALHKCRPIRYYDAVSSTAAEVKIETLLEKNKLQEETPLYRLDFSAGMKSPLLDMISLDNLKFSLNGDISWSPEEPLLIGLKDFEAAIAFAKFNFSLETNLDPVPVINSLDFKIDELPIDSLLALVPDSLVKVYGLAGLTTDAVINLEARLDSAYNITTDTVPYASLNLEIPTCHLTHGRTRLDKFDLNTDVTLRGNDLNLAEVNIKQVETVGRSMNFKLKGSATNLIADPEVKCKVLGGINLGLLPRPLLKLIDGKVSGKIKADLDFAGRMSMLNLNNMHRLNVKGDIDADKVTWVTRDSVINFYADGACLKFTTKSKAANGNKYAGVKFEVDTVNYADAAMRVAVKDMTLGLGVLNTAPPKDSTIIIPIGGGLKVKTLSMVSDSDSMRVRARDVKGNVSIRRYQSQKRVPEFAFNLDLKRVSCRMPELATSVSDAQMHFDVHKVVRQKPARTRSDSISIDTAKINARRRAAAEKRANMTAEELEQYEMERTVARVLRRYDFEGSIIAKRAMLFTPYFPLRNRLSNINLKFNNDSISFEHVVYKAGRSDFNAQGYIGNIKNSLSSRRSNRPPLILKFTSTSDTIDVNQLADAFFKGSSYGISDMSAIDIDDEQFGADSIIGSDTLQALIIPRFIEADFRVNAKNVLYADLLLNNMNGNVLVSDGAVNMRRLEATTEIGSVGLSALYSAPDKENLLFGFGLQIKRFEINRFLDAVPTIDSIMPLMRDVAGVIDADVAATVGLKPNMDFDLPSLNALIQLRGDSLTLLDSETFKTLAKWLMFKNKNKNMIDRMSLDIAIKDNMMQVYPFMFDIDRYRLGIQGHNDLDLNFNYLVSVLKSPLPFKFGITLKGNTDNYKIRVGKAKFDEHQAVELKLNADSTRVNLVNEIENIFARGVSRAEFAKLRLAQVDGISNDSISVNENISASDSLLFIQEGVIEAPIVVPTEPTDSVTVDKPDNKPNKKRKK